MIRRGLLSSSLTSPISVVSLSSSSSAACQHLFQAQRFDSSSTGAGGGSGIAGGKSPASAAAASIGIKMAPMDFGKKKTSSSSSSSSGGSGSKPGHASTTAASTPSLGLSQKQEDVRSNFIQEQIALHQDSGEGTFSAGVSHSQLHKRNMSRSGMLGAVPKRPSVRPRGLKDPSRADKMVMNLMELSKEGKALKDAAAADSSRSAYDPVADQHSNEVKKFTKPTDGISKVMPSLRFQPLNPLLADREEGCMARRPPGKDPNAIFNPSSRRKLSKMRFTQAQTDAIVDAWAAKQGGLWGICWQLGTKVINPHNIKRYKRIGNFGVFVCMFVVSGILYWHYRTEMDLFMLLDADDQRAYKAVLLNARVCEWRYIAEAALDKSDPLRIGSDKDKMVTILNALRDAGLVDRDWEVWARNNRKSLFKEPVFDIFCEIFWNIIMYGGRYLIGGGYVWMSVENKLDQQWAAKDVYKRVQKKQEDEVEVKEFIEKEGERLIGGR